MEALITPSCSVQHDKRVKPQAPPKGLVPHLNRFRWVSICLYCLSYSQIMHSDNTTVISAMINFSCWFHWPCHHFQASAPTDYIKQPTLLQHHRLQPDQGGDAMQCTQPVSMHISSLYHKLLSLLVTDIPKNPIIMGILWLHLHNPHISWSQQEITKWSECCNQHCLAVSIPSYHWKSWFQCPFTYYWVKLRVQGCLQ